MSSTPRGFRVQGISVEGFKGFTELKDIDFDERHIFLLGKNGNGKSSIIEAVRWGLFGSTRRRNEVVANQHYPGDCRVVVTLMSEGRKWKLRRTFTRGASGASTPVLTDENGNVKPIREVMPQLDSVDAGEEMHIIFASQAAPVRLISDLNPLERTVFNHLGLTYPRALLREMTDFLERQRETEDDLGRELTERRNDIDLEISQLEDRESNILSSPPWVSGSPPSIADSENKARSLIEEITHEALDDSLEGVSLRALINTAQDALNDRRERELDGLKRDAAEISLRHKGLEALRDIHTSIKTQGSSIESTRSQMETALDGSTLDELRERVESARADADAEVLKRRIVEDALALLNHNESDTILCPICESEHNEDELELALSKSASHFAKDADRVLADLESHLERCGSLSNLIDFGEADLVSLKQKGNEARALINEDDSRNLDSSNDIDGLIDGLIKQGVSIGEEIANQGKWLNEIGNRLSRLEDEMRFHQIQMRLRSSRNSKKRFRRVEVAYQDLVTFGRSAKAIHEAIGANLNDLLAKGLPRVSETFSEVFAALTDHPWYDRLVISERALPNLHLRVASSRDPFRREDPTGVLNGQAESALLLVPYFAFSQTDDAPTEVYLVMLDDPTRAFDADHIEILVRQLAKLGHHVQLIVASQESERFKALLPTVFPKESYAIVEPSEWSYDSGPELIVEYG